MTHETSHRDDPRYGKILQALAGIIDPVSGQDLVTAKLLSEIIIHDDKVSFSLMIKPDEAGRYEPVRVKASEAAKVKGITKALVSLTSVKGAEASPERPAPQPKPKGQLLSDIKAVIAVASGKGGVGKSTTAINLALALQARGLNIGLLDADVFGPSLPRLLDIHENPQKAEGKAMKPLIKHGLELMSIGFLVDEGMPVVWRGPMVMSAITQMLRDVAWSALDVLIVDMPPGTGDAQLTLAQIVPLAGAVIVSTPQDLALIDARKGLAMFQQVNVPVLGIVENMSYYQCPSCGHWDEIFAHGGAEAEAKHLNVPFLARLPLSTDIRAASDAGRPIVIDASDGVIAKAYHSLASGVAEQLFGGGLLQKPAPKIIFES